MKAIKEITRNLLIFLGACVVIGGFGASCYFCPPYVPTGIGALLLGFFIGYRVGASDHAATPAAPTRGY